MRKPLPIQQSDDLAALARLLISLATQQRTAAEPQVLNKSMASHDTASPTHHVTPIFPHPQVLNKSMAYINATFSPDFGHFLLLCLSGGTERPPTVHDAVALVSGRMMTQFAQTQWHEQALRAEMYKEMENGRLLRLLSKVRDGPALPHIPHHLLLRRLL